MEMTPPADLMPPGPPPEGGVDHEALLQFLYQAPVGLVRTSLAGEVEMMNPAAAQVLMPLSPRGDLDNLFRVLAPWVPRLPEWVAAFAAPSGTVLEPLRLTIGEVGTRQRVLSLALTKLAGIGLMATVSDVTDEVQREQQHLDRRLRLAARTDLLTRMPNRSALRERVAELIARRAEGQGDTFAVLFINCDRFRAINEGPGQAAGDAVLGLMAERLRGVLRQVDRVGLIGEVGDEARLMAARTGGDEFVVVLDQLSHADDVHAVAQRLVTVLCQPYGVDDFQLHCGVSLGLVLPAQCGGDADAVLRDASIAMAEAKRAGGARYKVFEPAMRERATQRADIESALRSALAEGQLFVVYQPLLGLPDSADAAMPSGPSGFGVEALVRWQHPVRGVVSPLLFIGVAEECGLIGALGDFVLDTACRQFMAWQGELGAAAPQQLAVNLSRAQLAQPGWVDTVQRLLAEIGMPPARLQLEVTESLAAQDELVRERLHALKALGLSIALDDFGTGYSSLSSLHQLPVDTVKIDRSFVSQVDTSLHHRVLIEATVRVAHSLGMATVAEGIETDAQRCAVQALGCDKGQGFLFSRPVTAQALSAWVRSR